MNLVDVLIVSFVLLAGYRWYRVGLIRNIFSNGGLILGIILGLVLSNLIIGIVAIPLVRFLVVIAIVGLSGFGLGYFGEIIGQKLNIKIKDHNLILVDKIIGAIGGGLFVLILSWISAAIIITSPFTSLNKQFQNSAIIQYMNKNLPATPPIINRINALIKPIDFPKVFAGVPEKLATPVTPAGSETLRSAVSNAGNSTVRIEAKGCSNTISSGSGFVVEDNLIMTNSHVVAGSNKINVISTTGSFDARPVYFDPSMDIAILRTEKLKLPKLKITDRVYERGQEAVAMGFPGGGEFKAEPIGITRALKARGFDIYNINQISREVYEFVGNVVQGDSGGPMVLADGTVIGMVFASAENNPGFGYGLTAPEMTRAISKINNNGVSTQSCY
jgi:S1-C subfamily serine protease